MSSFDGSAVQNGIHLGGRAVGPDVPLLADVDLTLALCGASSVRDLDEDLLA